MARACPALAEPSPPAPRRLRGPARIVHLLLDHRIDGQPPAAVALGDLQALASTSPWVGSAGRVTTAGDRAATALTPGAC